MDVGNTKIDLSDLTLMIPARIDGTERGRNLKTTFAYLQKYFKCHIIVGEHSPSPIVPSIIRHPEYIHIKSDGLFHKTALLNQMVYKAKTPLVGMCDVDALVDPQRLKQACDFVRQGAAMAFPYDGNFIDIEGEFLNYAITTLSVDGLTERSGRSMSSPQESFGGMVIMDKKSLIAAGMHNERFVAWGSEDQEIHLRFKKLGYSIKRVDGPLFHMSHPSCASRTINHSHHDLNEEEYYRIWSITQPELVEYVKSWSWVKITIPKRYSFNSL